MFLKVLEITPTSVLTFRKVPMSHKIINSYNFVPPTTLSGFLYRLLKLSNNEDLPKPKRFKSEKPEISEYHILERKEETKGVFSLGAYPVDLKSSVTFKSFRMGYKDLFLGNNLAGDLVTFRKNKSDVLELLESMKSRIENYKEIKQVIKNSFDDYRFFNYVYAVLNYYSDFDRKIEVKVVTHNKEKYKAPKNSTFGTKIRRQPLDWYFCSAEKFYGFLISENPDLLDMFDKVENYGFKIGKEGFAYVSKVYQTSELIDSNGQFISSTIVPTTNSKIKLKKIPEVESVYYFDLSAQRFVREMFALNGTLVEGEFYKAVLDELEVNIPKVTVKLLTGDLKC